MKAFWQWISKPPYLGLPWLVWSYAILSCIILSQGGVFTGHLIGWDDQVRMTQVLNWVNGAGWYDRTMMRANAPEGFTSIWSRIVDIPLALGVVIAQQFVPQKIAALISAAIVSVIELGVLFIAAPYFVRPLVGKNKARLVILFLLFTSILNTKLTPFSTSGFLLGQASHHPWYIILALTMFGAVTRLAMGSASRAPIFMLAGSIALLTAVGIEGFPLIGGAAAILVCAAWGGMRPLVAKRGGIGFFYGALGSVILLPMHQPPSQLLTISFAEPSIVGGILIASAGIFLLIERNILRCPKVNRNSAATLLCGTALAFAAVLVFIFRQILDGGAAGLSPAERHMALREHFEARPVYSVAHDIASLVGLLLPTVISLVAGTYAIVTGTTTRRRTIAFCYFGFAALGGTMEMLYSRYCHHALTTACAWLLWVWEEVKKRLPKDNFYGLKAFGAFVLLGPFGMLLLGAIFNNWPVTTFVLLFPATTQMDTDPCDSLALADYINTHYSKDTLLLVPYWRSAQFLYQTDVRIDFLANYPSHDKFIDHYAFLGSTSETSARDIARRHGFDLVAICTEPPLYRSYMPPKMQSLIARLQVGDTPSWLKEVKTDVVSNYHLFAVDKEVLAKQEP